MFLFVKQVVRQLDTPIQPALPPVTSAPEEFCSFTPIFLKDILSNCDFLVDSGVSISVFPCPRSSSDDRLCLLTANGSPMVCSGTHFIPLLFSCCSVSKVYTWNFQLAPVSVPLLRVDFLEHKVVHADCLEDVVIRASPGSQPEFKAVSFLSAPQKIQKLLEKYLVVLFSDWFSALKPCHGVRHHLLTNPGPPVFGKTRRLDPEKLAAAQEEFSAM